MSGTKHEPKQAVGAIFQTREEAKQALAALHEAHYTKSWFGTTSAAIDADGDETITAETAVGLFVTPKSMKLVDALVAHGIEGDVARNMEAAIEPGEALVTVELGERGPVEAIALLEQHGGRTEASGTLPTQPISRSTATAPSGLPLQRRSTVSPDNDVAGSVFDDVSLAPVWKENVFYVRGRR